MPRMLILKNLLSNMNQQKSKLESLRAYQLIEIMHYGKALRKLKEWSLLNINLKKRLMKQISSNKQLKKSMKNWLKKTKRFKMLEMNYQSSLLNLSKKIAKLSNSSKEKLKQLKCMKMVKQKLVNVEQLSQNYKTTLISKRKN